MVGAAILTPFSLASAGPGGNTESDVLFDIICRLSFVRGEVILSSGKKSDFYFDMKPSMFDPQGARLMAKRLFEEVLAAGAAYVGGLEMGAVPITGAICSYSSTVGRPISGFFVRKRPKEHGVKKLVEGFAVAESLVGKKAVIVEDVTTSGASALKAVEACRELGADVRLVVSIVDRGEGAAETFAAQGIPFKSLYNAADFLNRSE
jgi:orotate phosphoribosyltransferase